ncbi:MAG TPA: hypothetical protein VII13_10525 [Vicinamibacteria bacterium]
MSALLLLQRHPPAATPDTRDTPAIGEGGVRIRCPRCGWEPRARDRWSCGCGHAWHTFDTGGVCPACRRVWEDTQCPQCYQWSRHADWYAWEGGGSPP